MSTRNAQETERRSARTAQARSAGEDAYWLGGEALVVPAWAGADAAADEPGWDDPAWRTL
jgi:hypothetical protein